MIKYYKAIFSSESAYVMMKLKTAMRTDVSDTRRLFQRVSTDRGKVEGLEEKGLRVVDILIFGC
uniref:GST N-terminal domain-containing protein n=1 Tax=Heterorhabditis bacteriophora TaxID=37862 RepID=A0A1I7XG08_HETBA